MGTLSEDGGFVTVKKVLVGAESYDSLKSAIEQVLAPAPQNAK